MDFDEFKELVARAVLTFTLFIVLLVLINLCGSCSSQKISYKQRETRMLYKPDSLNLKVEPADGRLKQTRRRPI